MTDRLKIGQEVLIHGYVDEIRKDTVIVRNEGGYFGTVECEVTDIEMPDTNKVLDKITEIIEPLRHLSIDEMSDIEWQILQVIDKYKAETETAE